MWVDNWILFLLSKLDDRCIELMNVIYFRQTFPCDNEGKEKSFLKD